MSPFFQFGLIQLTSGAGSCAVLFLEGTLYCIFNLAQAETQTAVNFKFEEMQHFAIIP